MQIRLFVGDRVMLLQLLMSTPGHPVLLQLAQRLMQKLSFSEEELQLHAIVVGPEETRWNSEGDEGRTFILGDRAHQICRDTLERFWGPVQKAGEMSQRQISLWAKFFPEVLLSEKTLDELLDGPEDRSQVDG